MIDIEDAARWLTERLERGMRRLRRQRAVEIADRLLPELAAALPSTRVTQFDPHPDGIVLPAGICLEPMDGGPAMSWRTATEVHLHPFGVSLVSVEASTNEWPTLPQGVRSVLRLTLSAPTAAVAPRRLALHLSGRDEDTFPWFQALSRDVLAAFARGPDGNVTPIGLAAQEMTGGLFPTPGSLPQESRLLNELFFCPASLLSVELTELPSVAGPIDVLVATRAIVPPASAGLFRTRCTAVVNEVCRRFHIEIDATRDEWELRPPNGDKVHCLMRVNAFERDTGAWPECDGWQLVRRRGRPMLVFRSPMFRPADPPTRFIRVKALCHQFGAGGAVCSKVEAPSGAIAELGKFESATVEPRRGGLSRWFTSGHAEPLTEAAFRRLLVQQAVLGGRVAVHERAGEEVRRRRARRMIRGLKLLGVGRDEYKIPTGEVMRGRRVRIEVQPDQFPGGGYWLAVLAIGRFLAASGPINEFTRLVIRTTPRGEESTLPPMFGRRATL